MAVVAALLDCREDIAVIDLARTWFVAAGRIGDLDMAHSVTQPAVGVQELSLDPLEVVEIELDAEPGRADAVHQPFHVGDRLEDVARVVVRVQQLRHGHDADGREAFRRPGEAVLHAPQLAIPRFGPVARSGKHVDLAVAEAPRVLDSLLDRRSEQCLGRRIGRVATIALREVADLHVERIEREPSGFKRLRDGGDAARCHPVHFHGVKARRPRTREPLHERHLDKEELEVGREAQHVGPVLVDMKSHC